MTDDAFPPGGPPLASISGNWKCFNLCVFELVPMLLGILATEISLWFGSPLLYRPHHVLQIRIKVSWCGENLCYAAGQTYTLTERWSVSPRERKSRSTDCSGYPQKAAMSTNWIVTNWHFWTILTEGVSVLFPSLVRQMLGNNRQIWGTVCTLPT